MIALIIHEAVWLFVLWWDHDKPLGVLLDIVMLAIPFIYIAYHTSQYGNSGLSYLDAELLDNSDSKDPNYIEPPHRHPESNQSSHHKSHAEWVAETNEKARKVGEEYDRMWADEYLDEHDC